MAYYKISANKRGVLQAKVQAYGLDPATGKSKLYVQTIHNLDGLSESKFKKYVAKAAMEFEEKIKYEGVTSAAAVSDRVLTFSELIKEWEAHVLNNLSKNYYRRICDTEKRFLQFLIDNNLAHRPISEITVRHIQLFLNTFSSGKQIETGLVKLKKPFPKKVVYKEIVRQKFINANSLYRLVHEEASVKKESAKAICDFYDLKMDEYFEPTYRVMDYAPETIKNYRRTLRTLFNEAVRYEWITKNPVYFIYKLILGIAIM